MSVERIHLFKKWISFEDELNLFDIKIGGLYFWECIRLDLFDEYVDTFHRESNSDFVSNYLQSNLYKKLLNYFKIFTVNFKRIPLFTGQQKALFFSHSRRRQMNDNTYWDVYTDYLVDNLGFSSISMEGQHQYQHYEPAHTKNLKYTDLFFLKAKLLGKFFPYALTGDEKKGISAVQSCFSEKFSIDFRLEERIVRFLTIRSHLKPRFKKFLKKLNPEYFFMTCYYVNTIFIEIAQELGIKTIEIQHGSNSNYHLGYYYQREKRYRTDYILTFGEFWKKNFTWPCPQDKIYSIGFPYLLEKLNKYRKNEKKKQILLITGFPNTYDLIDFVYKALPQIPQEYKIFIKLHPAEIIDWEKRYKMFFNERFHFLSNDSDDIHYYLSESEFQIGVHSTAIYEGMELGCKTILVDLPGVDYMDIIIEEGFAKKIDEPCQLDLNAEYKLAEPGEFFDPNWKENFAGFISDLKGAAK